MGLVPHSRHPVALPQPRSGIPTPLTSTGAAHGGSHSQLRFGALSCKSLGFPAATAEPRAVGLPGDGSRLGARPGAGGAPDSTPHGEGDTYQNLGLSTALEPTQP